MFYRKSINTVVVCIPKIEQNKYTTSNTKYVTSIMCIYDCISIWPIATKIQGLVKHIQTQWIIQAHSRISIHRITSNVSGIHKIDTAIIGDIDGKMTSQALLQDILYNAVHWDGQLCSNCYIFPVNKADPARSNNPNSSHATSGCSILLVTAER